MRRPPVELRDLTLHNVGVYHGKQTVNLRDHS